MSKKKIVIIIVSALVALTLIIGGIHIVNAIKDHIRREELKRLAREYYENKLLSYASENAGIIPGEVDAVFLGDSLTDGYDLAKYYPGIKALNRGISGDTTVGLEDRLEVSVYDVKPKVALMLIGANNMDTMLENYEDILKGFKENLPDTEIMLISLTAMGGEHWGRKNQLACYNNVAIKKLAEEYGYTYIDVYTPLFDPRIGEVYEGLTTDGGHFTNEGYEVVTATIMPYLYEALGIAQ